MTDRRPYLCRAKVLGSDIHWSQIIHATDLIEALAKAESCADAVLGAETIYELSAEPYKKEDA